MFLDTTLPFGLWSASKIFNSVSDALEWVLKRRDVAVVHHYLVTLGEPGGATCARNMQIIVQGAESKSGF